MYIKEKDTSRQYNTRVDNMIRRWQHSRGNAGTYPQGGTVGVGVHISTDSSQSLTQL